MARELSGKKIVIVGATGSLGAQLASQLSQAGAVVSAVVRDASNLDATAISQHAIAPKAIIDGERDLPVEAFAV